MVTEFPKASSRFTPGMSSERMSAQAWGRRGISTPRSFPLAYGERITTAWSRPGAERSSTKRRSSFIGPVPASGLSIRYALTAAITRSTWAALMPARGGATCCLKTREGRGEIFASEAVPSCVVGHGVEGNEVDGDPDALLLQRFDELVPTDAQPSAGNPERIEVSRVRRPVGGSRKRSSRGTHRHRDGRWLSAGERARRRGIAGRVRPRPEGREIVLITGFQPGVAPTRLPVRITVPDRAVDAVGPHDGDPRGEFPVRGDDHAAFSVVIVLVA
jgi:hypothetical protein